MKLAPASTNTYTLTVELALIPYLTVTFSNGLISKYENNHLFKLALVFVICISSAKVKMDHDLNVLNISFESNSSLESEGIYIFLQSKSFFEEEIIQIYDNFSIDFYQKDPYSQTISQHKYLNVTNRFHTV